MVQKMMLKPDLTKLTMESLLDEAEHFKYGHILGLSDLEDETYAAVLLEIRSRYTTQTVDLNNGTLIRIQTILERKI